MLPNIKTWSPTQFIIDLIKDYFGTWLYKWCKESDRIQSVNWQHNNSNKLSQQRVYTNELCCVFNINDNSWSPIGNMAFMGIISRSNLVLLVWHDALIYTCVCMYISSIPFKFVKVCKWFNSYYPPHWDRWMRFRSQSNIQILDQRWTCFRERQQTNIIQIKATAYTVLAFKLHFILWCLY